MRKKISPEGCIIFIATPICNDLEACWQVAIKVKRIQCRRQLATGKVAGRAKQNEDTGIKISRHSGISGHLMHPLFILQPRDNLPP